MERTLVLFKPDCVQRRLVGRLLSRFEDKGFNLVAMKLMRVTPELAGRHYAEHVHKDWYPALEAFITSGPLVAAVVEGPEAVRVVREMVGPTNGRNAPAGTIRGDFRLQPADEPDPRLPTAPRRRGARSVSSSARTRSSPLSRPSGAGYAPDED